MTSSTLSTSPGQLKAIETVYNGYRFRSRLEARWAVFFDAMDVEYQYEPEGFDLGDGVWYLPDFWLPHIETWVEIKPTELDSHEQQKAYLLSAQSGQAVLSLFGYPNARFEEISDDGYGLWMKNGFGMELFTGDWWNKVPTGAECGRFLFDLRLSEDWLPDFLKTKYPDALVPDVGNDEKSIRRLIYLDQKYYRAKYGKEHPGYEFGRRLDDLGWEERDDGKIEIKYLAFYTSTRIKNALLAARQARFEHGESG